MKRILNKTVVNSYASNYELEVQTVMDIEKYMLEICNDYIFNGEFDQQSIAEETMNYFELEESKDELFFEIAFDLFE